MPSGIYKRTREHKEKLRKPKSEEHKRKLSEAHKGKILSKETRKKMSDSKIGEKNSFYEKRHTLEAKEKIKIKAIGRKISIETRKKMSLINKGKNNPNYGKSLSNEHKEKLRKFHTGLKPSKETRDLWSKQRIGKGNSFYGKKHSKETIDKIKLKRKNWKTPFKDSTIEIKIQNFLSKLHIEYFTHKYISEITHSYQCDIFIPEQSGFPQKTIIECDGCFFHVCPVCKLKEYTWTKERKQLDKLRTNELINKGYKVIRIWEHDIRKMELNDLNIILK